MLVVAGAVLEEGEGVGVGSPAPRQLLHRRLANVPVLVVAGAVLEDEEEGEGVGVGSPAPRQLLHRRPANVLMLVVAGAVLEEGEGVGVGSPAPPAPAPPPANVHARRASRAATPAAWRTSPCSSLRARSLRKGRVSGSVRQPRASSCTAASRTSSSPSLSARSFKQLDGFGAFASPGRLAAAANGFASDRSDAGPEDGEVRGRFASSFVPEREIEHTTTASELG